MTADPVRWLWATVAAALWLMIVAVVAWRRARSRRAAVDRAAALGSPGDADDLLVAFASQTGHAGELAWMTASSLSQAGVPARVAPLGDLDPADLRDARRVLIVASTTGEGDGPDAMSGFARKHMTAPAELAGLSYALLALGDRTYADFCGFGRALDLWLRRSGATPLFDPVEVDDGDIGAIRHWLHQLGAVTGHPRLRQPRRHVDGRSWGAGNSPRRRPAARADGNGSLSARRLLRLPPPPHARQRVYARFT